MWTRLVGGIGAAILVVVLVVAGVVAYAYSSADVNTAGKVEFSHALQIPPIAESTVTPDGTRVFDLEMRQGIADLGHGPETETWGVNGDYLGPTIRMTRGEPVRMNVRNELGEASTLHWHGMHLPAAMDGGPHQMVEPDATWSPDWVVDQPAATLWYHPHLHGSTAEHVYRGLAGMMIVDDPAGAALPDRYGVDDIPLIVQDKTFDGDQLNLDPPIFSDTGILGDEILVNGTPAPYLDVTTERVRLRLLNASNARVYDFGFDTGLPFDLIGTDGGLIEAPQKLESIMLSPGERAEIVVEIPPGTDAVLRSTPPDLGADFMTERFAGGADTLDVLELRAAETLEPNTEIPHRLAEKKDLGEPERTRKFELNGSRSINGKEMDMSRIDEVVTLGTTEVWEVRNVSGEIHNFHVHDVQFQVLDTDNPALSGPKDTVYVPPGEAVRLLVRFTDYADPSFPYMYHCHMLLHEDQGMMGQFVIVDKGEKPDVRVQAAALYFEQKAHSNHGGQVIDAS
ncbi:MAG: multicopper oxidase domain-containing protein, partial [Rhodococcus sp.]|nr:multicopper oxidase domain-containing protein [Rhodococcus sp. (in: high G+C Gram-positive bacteria)]